MRWNIPVLCAAVMLAGFGAPSHAAEVRIGDFEFSCKFGDKTVKPKFGDIDGIKADLYRAMWAQAAGFAAFVIAVAALAVGLMQVLP